eukprot:m.20070 g.20070  ORF g.20070 m.20070 type:complete len:133 (+) comp6743_c0_seq1:28-426(+)
MAELEAVFELFDKDGSGIAPGDLGTALRTAGKMPSDEDVAEMSGGGAVDKAKFLELCGKEETPKQSEVLTAFEVFDQQGGGYISLNELKHVMKNLGEGLDDSLLEKMSQACAPDSEGQVNIRHFVDVLFKGF